jgi:16S rRNA (uracil1498-N3)-methyltransferase
VWYSFFMRLHRFYITTPISQETFDIADKDLVHQWKKVFRYNVGSQVVLFDGSGADYLCIITSLRNLGASVSVLKKRDLGMRERRNVWLCLALIKKDNFELVVQKATELGVTNIVPLLCEHSEKKNLNMDRLSKIAVEASEQSGRGDIPVIHPVSDISDLLSLGVLPQQKILFHPSGIPFEQFRAVSEPSVCAFVGPEGGWSDAELATFASFNILSISLGSQILRAETAAIAVSSLLLL